jgi:metal-responsive CopG/Arc/MetJ family transcriptional regulator
MRTSMELPEALWEQVDAALGIDQSRRAWIESAIREKLEHIEE